MCFPFSFGASGARKRKSASAPADRKRRDARPHADVLRGNGAVVAGVDEKRRSTSERQRKSRSRDSSRRERDDTRYPYQQQAPQYHQYQQQAQQYTRSPHDMYRNRAQYRTPLNVEVPTMWHRTVDHPTSNSSSTEMLLNPRPQRTQHPRQRHPKQATLRGHGAKREKSRKEMRQQQQPTSSWSIFGPSSSSPPRTPRRRERDRERERESYKTIDTSPRSHRSPRTHTQSHHHAEPSSSSSSRPHHRSRTSTSQAHRPPTSSSSSRPPQNTAVRRTPDRRFAVLAATNTALEDLRREAFAQATPPPAVPRRERLRRYQGVTLPAASIPYTWDCVSSGRESVAAGGTGGGESSTGRRRRR